jgi:hypothetical protein
VGVGGVGKKGGALTFKVQRELGAMVR